MSGVVLRCPNCGTTRSASGECEACHEAQVRYFCSNHTPGRWLEAAACPQCGARFGDPTRPPASASPPAPRPATTRTPPGTRPTGPAPVSPPARPRPRRSGEGATTTPPRGGPPATGPTSRRTPHARTPADTRADAGADLGRAAGPRTGAEGSPSPAGWREALIAAARTAHVRRTAATRTAPPPEEYPRPRRSGGGCFSRLILMLVFVFFALASMVMFGTGFLRMLLPY